jgi:hypothetical protein
VPFVDTIAEVFAWDVARDVRSARKDYLSFVVTPALTLLDVLFDRRAVSYEAFTAIE